jgi:broad specificity phosphatase PhoE
MTARLVLVRHGPSAHVEKLRLIDHAAVHEWRRAYDAAGIRAGTRPPAALIALAATAAHVVASDLPRAVQSAECLAPSREIRRSELLREAPLTVPRWPGRLPLHVWGVLIHLAWTYRVARGIDLSDAEWARAAAAADWLTNLVSDGSTAVVVTHGVFRPMVADQLTRRGWTGERRGGYRHWSAWSLAAP